MKKVFILSLCVFAGAVCCSGNDLQLKLDEYRQQQQTYREEFKKRERCARTCASNAEMKRVLMTSPYEQKNFGIFTCLEGHAGHPVYHAGRKVRKSRYQCETKFFCLSHKIYWTNASLKKYEECLGKIRNVSSARKYLNWQLERDFIKNFSGEVSKKYLIEKIAEINLELASVGTRPVRRTRFRASRSVTSDMLQDEIRAIIRNINQVPGENDWQDYLVSYVESDRQDADQRQTGGVAGHSAFAQIVKKRQLASAPVPQLRVLPGTTPYHKQFDYSGIYILSAGYFVDDATGVSIEAKLHKSDQIVSRAYLPFCEKYPFAARVNGGPLEADVYVFADKEDFFDANMVLATKVSITAAMMDSGEVPDGVWQMVICRAVDNANVITSLENISITRNNIPQVSELPAAAAHSAAASLAELVDFDFAKGADINSLPTPTGGPYVIRQEIESPKHQIVTENHRETPKKSNSFLDNIFGGGQKGGTGKSGGGSVFGGLFGGEKNTRKLAEILLRTFFAGIYYKNFEDPVAEVKAKGGFDAWEELGKMTFECFKKYGKEKELRDFVNDSKVTTLLEAVYRTNDGRAKKVAHDAYNNYVETEHKLVYDVVLSGRKTDDPVAKKIRAENSKIFMEFLKKNRE